MLSIFALVNALNFEYRGIHYLLMSIAKIFACQNTKNFEGIQIFSNFQPETQIIEELSKTTIYRTMVDGERTEVEASEYLPESLKNY